MASILATIGIWFWVFISILALGILYIIIDCICYRGKLDFIYKFSDELRLLSNTNPNKDAERFNFLVSSVLDKTTKVDEIIDTEYMPVMSPLTSDLAVGNYMSIPDDIQRLQTTLAIEFGRMKRMLIKKWKRLFWIPLWFWLGGYAIAIIFVGMPMKELKSDFSIENNSLLKGIAILADLITIIFPIIKMM